MCRNEAELEKEIENYVYDNYTFLVLKHFSKKKHTVWSHAFSRVESGVPPGANLDPFLFILHV